jgi:hypothetical protein
VEADRGEMSVSAPATVPVTLRLQIRKRIIALCYNLDVLAVGGGVTSGGHGVLGILPDGAPEAGTGAAQPRPASTQCPGSLTPPGFVGPAVRIIALCQQPDVLAAWWR